MRNLTQDEIHILQHDEQAFALYFYTPLCGTCQVASKMLDVVEQLKTGYSFGKADLNFMPEMAKKFSIESVPCLLLFQNGRVIEKLYAFHSVPYIYEKMTSKNNGPSE
jgi:thioredoxin-like negative regulator of GroEL